MKNQKQKFKVGDIVTNIGYNHGFHMYLLLTTDNVKSNWFSYYYINNGYLCNTFSYFDPKNFELYRMKNI